MPRAILTMRASSAAWWAMSGFTPPFVEGEGGWGLRTQPHPGLPFPRKGKSVSVLPILLVQALVQCLALHPRIRLLREARAARWSEAAATSSRSLRKLATRPASSSPRSTAARTAQPGSCARLQSRNLHCAASASMSAKLSATSSSPVGESSRMPGVSIRHAPKPAPAEGGSATSARWWWCGGRDRRMNARRRFSSSRCRAGCWRASTCRRPNFPPAPRCGPSPSHGSSAATLARSLAFTTTTATPPIGSGAGSAARIADSDRIAASTSAPSLSALVNTTTGCTPLPESSSR